MAVLNQAKYLSFDHQYVETIVVTDATRIAEGIHSNRFVLRSGAYAPANGYAAGVSIFDIYGTQALTGYTQLSLGNINIAATTGVVSRVAGNTTDFSTTLAVGAVVAVEGINYTVVSIASASVMTLALLGGGTIAAVTNKPATRLETKGGYSVIPPSGPSLLYEDRQNGSTTPLAPRVFPYQRHLSVVTTGIAIVQLDPIVQTISVDSPIAVGTEGRAKLRDADNQLIIGRSLDSLVIANAGDTGYIRVKLGNEVGA